jgi:hypothetical protein
MVVRASSSAKDPCVQRRSRREVGPPPASTAPPAPHCRSGEVDDVAHLRRGHEASGVVLEMFAPQLLCCVARIDDLGERSQHCLRHDVLLPNGSGGWGARLPCLRDDLAEPDNRNAVGATPQPHICHALLDVLQAHGQQVKDDERRRWRPGRRGRGGPASRREAENPMAPIIQRSVPRPSAVHRQRSMRAPNVVVYQGPARVCHSGQRANRPIRVSSAIRAPWMSTATPSLSGPVSWVLRARVLG